MRICMKNVRRRAAHGYIAREFNRQMTEGHTYRLDITHAVANQLRRPR